MNPIDLYHFPCSPPSRAVLLLFRFLGIAVNVKVINILEGEQLTPEYLKMNPMHTVPTIDDNGFYLWESRAIMQYLVDQYAKDAQKGLMPKDPRRAAIVNQLLYFDGTSLVERLFQYFVPVILKNQRPDPEKKQRVEDAMQGLNTILGQSKWVAGDEMTIADISLLATVSTVESLGFDMSKYPNVEPWLVKCKNAMVDYDDSNGQGISLLGGKFKRIISAFE